MDAIVVAIDMIHQHCRHLKYEKTITVLGSLSQSPTELDESDHHQIATSLDTNQIKLQFVYHSSFSL